MLGNLVEKTVQRAFVSVCETERRREDCERALRPRTLGAKSQRRVQVAQDHKFFKAVAHIAIADQGTKAKSHSSTVWTLPKLVYGQPLPKGYNGRANDDRFRTQRCGEMR